MEDATAAPSPRPLGQRLERHLPILGTLRTYRLDQFRHDAQASLTVALLDVPQAIAYALIAGLPPVYGLYTSIVTALVTSLLNSSSHVISGPTNAVSIMVAGALINTTHPALAQNPAGLIALLTLLVGIIQLGFGLAKVGNLAQFVSRSVLIGFTAGAGILIAVNQLAPLLGLTFKSSPRLLEQAANTIRFLEQINLYACLIGLGSIALVLIGKRYFPRVPFALIAVVLSAAVVGVFDLEQHGVRTIGAIPNTLPGFALPPFDLRLLADLADDALAIAILGLIESLSIAKSISVQSGERINSNQDFVSLGSAHIVASCFQCMPGCGSFTRSALNYSSGAATRIAGLLAALWVALILMLFGPFAQHIPTASLSGLLVVLGLSLVKWKSIRTTMRSTGSDAIVLALTLFCTLLLHLETAIFVGVVASLVLFLRKASAPHLVEYDMAENTLREISANAPRSNPGISIIHVEGDLFFGAAELFEDQVRALAADPSIKVVILRMKNARHLDATAVLALDSLLKYMRSHGRLLLISGATKEVMKVLTRSGVAARIGEDCVFPAEENLTAATRKALLKAKEFIGTQEKAEVRVFYDETRMEKGPPTAPAA